VFMELSPFELFACAVVTLKVSYTGCGLMRIGTMFGCQEWRRKRKKVYCLREGDRTVAAERAVGPEMRTSKGEKFSRTECRMCLKGMEMGLDWVAVLRCISWGERDSGTERCTPVPFENLPRCGVLHRRHGVIALLCKCVFTTVEILSQYYAKLSFKQQF
jgi:hypothetical protein